ncbi:MAG TPA: basic amino acid ABC transporter substrate-binding protein [Actinomycetota bacterium]|nr:basic amino acid ABC transporter substrate-binding protein [Actinomycetota bacterium]
MTRWKNLPSVALASALLLVGAACREETPPAGGGGGGTGTPQVTTLEEGVLTIGTDLPYPPFEYREGGELTGFDVDIMEEIASRLGLTPEWVDSPFDTIFTDLANGQFDVVISGATITPEREQEVNFSDPYFRSLQALVVLEDSGIQSFDDLGQGDSVSVQSGTTGELWAEENLAPNGVEIRAFPEYPPVYNALEAGQVDGVVYDESSAIPETFNRPGTAVVDTVDTNEFYGIAVDPNNPDLLDAVNEALAAMVEDGSYEEIYGSYPNCLEEEVETCMVPGGNVAAA